MKKPRILSIDDEVNFTDFLKQYFEPRGYEIDVTSEGTEGLQLLKEKKYDVVLLDLKMAGLDGQEVLREIKKLDSSIQTIFITAYTDSGATKARLLREGAYAYIEKPVTSLKNLENLVNKAANTDK
ncbi:MAG: response regulator [Candidatus Omnitrophota bacterium]